MSTIERALQKNKQAKQASKAEAATQTSDSQIEKAVATAPESPQVETSSHHTTSHQPALSGNALDIPLQQLSNEGFVSVGEQRALINEEYRAIKRKLLNNAFGPLASTLRNSNIIMVTSSSPSEGKTFTAVNLALSIALEQDKTVLLVDADVLRPKVMTTLKLQQQEGLMEFLLGEKQNVAEVMYRTNLDKLRIIPAGKSHHLSTELLASEKMREAVEEFANRYTDRVVIVDTPPLLGINETSVLANLAGQAVMVVEEGKARMRDIRMATELFDPQMAVGFVVNKSLQNDKDRLGYGYYYAAEAS